MRTLTAGLMASAMCIAMAPAAASAADAKAPAAKAPAYKAAKNQWEQDAVCTGLVPPLEDLHAVFVAATNSALPQEEFLNRVVPALQEEFKANPPLICTESLDLLRRLRRTGCTVSVGSNTNFIIRGRVIYDLLPCVGVFDFQLYSDELGVCKPSPEFFAHVLLRAGTANRGLLRARQVVQIGDSLQCDVRAAEFMGMRAILVGAEYTTAQVLESLVRRHEQELEASNLAGL